MQYVSDNISITCFSETHKKWSQTSQTWQKIRLFTCWQMCFFSLQVGSYLCFYLGVVRLCRNCKKKRKTCTYSIQVVLCMWGETNAAAPVLHRIAPTVPWVMHRFRLEILLENKIKQKEEFKMSGLLNRFKSLPVWFTLSYMTTTVHCVRKVFRPFQYFSFFFILRVNSVHNDKVKNWFQKMMLIY